MSSSQGGRSVGWGKGSWGELVGRGSKGTGERPAHRNPLRKSRERSGTGRVGRTAEGFEPSFAVTGAREALKVGETWQNQGFRGHELLTRTLWSSEVCGGRSRGWCRSQPPLLGSQTVCPFQPGSVITNITIKNKVLLIAYFPSCTKSDYEPK